MIIVLQFVGISLIRPSNPKPPWFAGFCNLFEPLFSQRKLSKTLIGQPENLPSAALRLTDQRAAAPTSRFATRARFLRITLCTFRQTVQCSVRFSISFCKCEIMAADQAQFHQLLNSLLSTDNEVRTQAEVRFPGGPECLWQFPTEIRSGNGGLVGQNGP